MDKKCKKWKRSVWKFIAVARLSNNEKAMQTTLWFLLGEKR